MSRLRGPLRQGDLNAAAVFARRITEIRERRGWSQSELTRLLKERGYPVGRGRIAKLETERTKPTILDLFGFAFVFDTSPLYMLTTLDEYEPRIVIAGEGPVKPADVRAWLRADKPLLKQNPKVFIVERPTTERRRALADPDLPEPIAAEIIDRGAAQILKEEA